MDDRIVCRKPASRVSLLEPPQLMESRWSVVLRYATFPVKAFVRLPATVGLTVDNLVDDIGMSVRPVAVHITPDPSAGAS